MTLGHDCLHLCPWAGELMVSKNKGRQGNRASTASPLTLVTESHKQAVGDDGAGSIVPILQVNTASREEAGTALAADLRFPVSSRRSLSASPCPAPFLLVEVTITILGFFQGRILAHRAITTGTTQNWIQRGSGEKS